MVGQTMWDREELLERLEGDHEFLRELLAIFQQDAPRNLEKARESLAARNYPELTRAAHTLKGMLKNLAMSGAGQIAANLEDAARQESQAEAQENLRLLENELDRLCPEIEAQLAEVKP